MLKPLKIALMDHQETGAQGDYMGWMPGPREIIQKAVLHYEEGQWQEAQAAALIAQAVMAYEGYYASE